MSATTKIEWTDATWSPIRMRNGDFPLANKTLTAPLRRRKPTRYAMPGIDLFHESVPDEWIDRVFAAMALAPQHRFQVLTKRSARMREYLRVLDSAFGAMTLRSVRMRDAARKAGALLLDINDLRAKPWPLPNVWLGVSIEDQRTADERIPDLLATPAAVRWVSAEPLLGAIKLTRLQQSDGSEIDSLFGSIWCPGAGSINSITFRGRTRLNWVVVGGESGKGARPMHPNWVRTIRDQCAAAGVPFLFKQWGEHLPDDQMSDDCPFGSQLGRDPAGKFPDKLAYWHVGKARAGRLLDGLTHDAYPEKRT